MSLVYIARGSAAGVKTSSSVFVALRGFSPAVGGARRSARAAKPADHGAHGVTRPTAGRILLRDLIRGKPP